MESKLLRYDASRLTCTNMTKMKASWYGTMSVLNKLWLRESGLCLLLSIFTRKKQTLISFDRRNDEEISVNFKNLKNDKITPACI